MVYSVTTSGSAWPGLDLNLPLAPARHLNGLSGVTRSRVGRGAACRDRVRRARRRLYGTTLRVDETVGSLICDTVGSLIRIGLKTYLIRIGLNTYLNGILIFPAETDRYSLQGIY